MQLQRCNWGLEVVSSLARWIYQQTSCSVGRRYCSRLGVKWVLVAQHISERDDRPLGWRTGLIECRGN